MAAIRAKIARERIYQQWAIGSVLFFILLAVVLPSFKESMKSPYQRAIEKQLEEISK